MSSASSRTVRSAARAGLPPTGISDLGRRSTATHDTAPGPVLGRRISVPRVLLGSMLVLTMSVAGLVVARQVDTRLPVVVVARSLDAGQTIRAGDVSAVRVAADTTVATIPADQMMTVVGHQAALPLSKGSLLGSDEVGPTSWPPVGQALAAVAIKPGHAPAGLSAGMHVTVLLVPGAPTTGSDGGTGAAAPVVQANGVVVTVMLATDESGATLVTLLLGAADAAAVVSAAGDASLVQVGETG